MRPIDVDTIYGVALALFAFGLIFGTASTGLRMLSLRRRGLTQPRLIWRDILVVGLLALDFLIIAAHRVAGLPFADHEWFAVLTSSLAVGAVAVYGYYEWRVIGHVRERRDWPETPIEAEDRQVGDERRRLQALAEDDEEAAS